MTTRRGPRVREALRALTTVYAHVYAVAFVVGVAGNVAHADDYVYNAANKVDPFQPMSLRKPNIRGVSRLQDYETAQLELVGTVLGAEITALILTPEPREGVLAKIGDRVGRKGGRIIAIARDKVVVREPNQGLVESGRPQKFNDVTMTLSSREQLLRKRVDTDAGLKESDKFGFPALGGNQGSPDAGGAGKAPSLINAAPPPVIGTPTFIGTPHAPEPAGTR